MDRSDPKNLLPFYTRKHPFVSSGKEKICYDETRGKGNAKLVAEIELTTPEHCIPKILCNNMVCPITDKHFQSGDAVYISNSDHASLKAGIPVECTSITGLRAVVSQAAETLQEGPDGLYSIYFIFGDYNERLPQDANMRIRRAQELRARVEQRIPRDFLPRSTIERSDSNSSTSTSEERETSTSKSSAYSFSFYIFFILILTSLYVFITREKGHKLDVHLLT